MDNQTISALSTTDSEVFADCESFLTDLSANDESMIAGGFHGYHGYRSYRSYHPPRRYYYKFYKRRYYYKRHYHRKSGGGTILAR